MDENYQKALTTLDKWFTLESNPAPEPFILRAQILYNLSRYKEMVSPIENAMRVARERDKPVKEDWYGLLNFAYFQQENYAKVRDIQKILLQNWPKARYWKSLAGAYTELGEDEKLIYAYDAAHTQGMLEKDTEFVTMAQLYLQAEVPYKAATAARGEDGKPVSCQRTRKTTVCCHRPGCLPGRREIHSGSAGRGANWQRTAKSTNDWRTPI